MLRIFVLKIFPANTSGLNSLEKAEIDIQRASFIY